MEAALSLFSNKGFHNVSMQEIADKSEFSVGSLYTFFDSKESLFEGLMNSFGQKIVSEFTEILDGPGDETERLAMFFRYSPRILEKYSGIIKLYTSVHGSYRIVPLKIHNKNRINEAIDSQLKCLIEQGIHKGIFRAVDIEITTKAIRATLSTLAFEIIGPFNKAKVTKMFKKVEQLFLNDLLSPQVKQNE